MEVALENIITYGVVALLISAVLFWYFRKETRKSEVSLQKLEKAKTFGLYEPTSLHPVVNKDTCIGSGACIQACPEKDILGIVKGKATTINTSRCVGHGACIHACPVLAISLHIGTEKRGVDIPDVSEEFESSTPMLFIAGELGGMGLIKNAVEQGRQAVDFAAGKINKNVHADYDLAIIGAGPAGISATLNAVKHGLSYITIDQDSIGGTVYTFPRAKLIMTSPMDLPLYGKAKFRETNKAELIGLWMEIIEKYGIKINSMEKVEKISKENEAFSITTAKGSYTSRAVILAIGRRGTPRKLEVPGEELGKIYYRLLEPEHIQNKDILVVGGGDSAIESALLLVEEQNRVTLSYRSGSFSRLKEANYDLITDAIAKGVINVIFNSVVLEVKENSVVLELSGGRTEEIRNDTVYAFIGGELPNEFLSNCGISVTTKYGDVMIKRK